MTTRFRSPLTAVSALWVLAAVSAAWLVPSCHGTETDNPIAEGRVPDDYPSPERSRPAAPGVPPCVPLSDAEVPSLPANPRTALLGSIAVSPHPSGGLRVTDLSDPDAPRPLSPLDAVAQDSSLRGDIHQLLAVSATRLAVGMTKNRPQPLPLVLPEPEQLTSIDSVLLVDLSDPTTPTRVAEVELDGEFFEMFLRDERLWVATVRRVPEQRGCAARPHPCGWVGYEAIVLNGYLPTDAGFELVQSFEQPFSARALVSSNGVVTNTGEGVHIARFGSDGLLTPMPPLLTSVDDFFWRTPLGFGADSVSWVEGTDAGANLVRFDLRTDPPTRAVEQLLGTGTEAPGAPSAFFGDHLWLADPYQRGRAPEVFYLTPAEAQPVALNPAWAAVLPIAGVELTEPGQAALAWSTSATTTTYELVAVSATSVTSIETWSGPEAARPPYSVRFPAPPSLGTGVELAWRGAGLPLELSVLAPPDPADLSTPETTERPLTVLSFLAVGDAESEPTEVSLVQTASAPIGPNPELRVQRGGASIGPPLSVSPGASRLLPLKNGVVVVSERSLEDCLQFERDCAGYAPGVAVVGVDPAPSLVAELPFPDLALPAVGELSRVDVDWQLDADSDLPPLADGRAVFVARVSLSCSIEADCEALGVTAVPLSEANVISGTRVDCPPPAPGEPPCNPGPPPPEPTVYGSEARQYFFVLDADGPDAPHFVSAGVSSLSTTERRGTRAGYLGEPRVSGQTAFATRLERSDPSGTPLPSGSVRVLFDRFTIDEGTAQSLPAVTVPGRPLARLDGGTDGGTETWLSVEALPGDAGLNRLHRLIVTGAATSGGAFASIDDSLDLPASLGRADFYGLGRPDLDIRVGTSDNAHFAVVVADPADGCGETQLVAVGLGNGDGAGLLSEWGRLALPSDGWQSVAVDADRVLLRRETLYALFQIAEGASPSLISVQDAGGPAFREQLLGRTLRALSPGGSGAVRIEF